MTTAELDRLFPNRHAEADRLGIHPSLRGHFVPLPTTDDQRDALFPGWRSAVKNIVETVWSSESLAGDVVHAAETDEALQAS